VQSDLDSKPGKAKGGLMEWLGDLVKE